MGKSWIKKIKKTINYPPLTKIGIVN
jgi:hypothetical protein